MTNLNLAYPSLLQSSKILYLSTLLKLKMEEQVRNLNKSSSPRIFENQSAQKQSHNVMFQDQSYDHRKKSKKKVTITESTTNAFYTESSPRVRNNSNLDGSQRNKMPKLGTQYRKKNQPVGLRKQSVQLPPTYVNGLPDMFAHIKQARDQFTWFKKHRKSHRDQDLLILSPYPMTHTEIHPDHSPANTLPEKVRDKTMLKDFQHPIYNKPYHKSNDQGKQITLDETIESKSAQKTKKQKQISVKIQQLNNQIGSFGNETTLSKNQSFSFGSQAFLHNQSIQKVGNELSKQHLDVEFTSADLRNGQSRSPLYNHGIHGLNVRSLEELDPKEEKVLFDQKGSDMQQLMNATSNSSILDYKIVTQRSPLDHASKKMIKIELSHKTSKRDNSINQIRSGKNFSQLDLQSPKYSIQKLNYRPEDDYLQSTTKNGVKLPNILSPNQQSFLDRINSKQPNMNDYAAIINRRNFSTLDVENNKLIRNIDDYKQIPNYSNELAMNKKPDAFWPRNPNEPITVFKQKHRNSNKNSPQNLNFQQSLVNSKRSTFQVSPLNDSSVERSANHTLDSKNNTHTQLLAQYAEALKQGQGLQQSMIIKEINNTHEHFNESQKKLNDDFMGMNLTNETHTPQAGSNSQNLHQRNHHLQLGGSNPIDTLDADSQGDAHKYLNNFELLDNTLTQDPHSVNKTERAEKSNFLKKGKKGSVPPQPMSPLPLTLMTGDFNFSNGNATLNFSQTKMSQNQSNQLIQLKIQGKKKSLGNTLGFVSKSPGASGSPDSIGQNKDQMKMNGSLKKTIRNDLQPPRYTPEQQFVLHQPFKNYLSGAMQKTYMDKVRKIQNSSQLQKKQSQPQNGVLPFQMTSTVSPKNPLFGMDSVEKIIEKTRGEGGTFSMAGSAGPIRESQKSFINGIMKDLREHKIDEKSFIESGEPTRELVDTRHDQPYMLHEDINLSQIQQSEMMITNAKLTQNMKNTLRNTQLNSVKEDQSIQNIESDPMSPARLTYVQGENIYKSQASKQEVSNSKEKNVPEFQITGTKVVKPKITEISKGGIGSQNQAIREGSEEVSQHSPEQEKTLKKNFGNLRSGETLVNDPQQLLNIQHGSELKIGQLETPGTPISGHFLMPINDKGKNKKSSSNMQQEKPNIDQMVKIENEKPVSQPTLSKKGTPILVKSGNLAQDTKKEKDENHVIEVVLIEEKLVESSTDPVIQQLHNTFSSTMLPTEASFNAAISSRIFLSSSSQPKSSPGSTSKMLITPQ